MASSAGDTFTKARTVSSLHCSFSHACAQVVAPTLGLILSNAMFLAPLAVRGRRAWSACTNSLTDAPPCSKCKLRAVPGAWARSTLFLSWRYS